MATIIGTPRNDLLLGTPADDLIFGLSGDDALVGQSGADVLDGGLGADYLRGGAGNDTYRVDALGDRVVETADALSMVRVSAAASGVQANDTSFDPVISASGRFIAFGSLASNLAFGETNVVQDVFVKDLLSGAVLRASTDANGVQGNNTSFGPSISADGRYVAFLSNATNLVADDRSVVADVFVKDLVTGAVVRASVSDRGVEANDSSLDAAISGDGHFVAFTSLASNLVVGDRNVATDVFVKDLHSGAIVIASSDSRGVSSIGGSSDATISADGSVVAFSSNASDLVPGFTGAVTGILVKNLASGAIGLASTTADGRLANDASFAPSISADGRFVAFQSAASNLVSGDLNATSDIFVKDLQTGAIVRVSTSADGAEANNTSDAPQISPDGNYVVFRSAASNLVPGDNGATADIFVKDLVTGAIARVSEAAAGLNPNDNSFGAAISADGAIVAFRSSASNLVAESPNTVPDVFAATPSIVTGGGTDTVESAISYVLPVNVENLTLIGGGDINGTGNALANVLAGNVGANHLSGGAGDDGLFGAPGNDILDGGDGADHASYAGRRANYAILGDGGQLVVASAQEGVDRLTSVEALVFSDRVLPALAVDSAREYIASYPDLMNAFGANGAAGLNHFAASGYAEGRRVTFDGLEYIASYGDLINWLGADPDGGATHYIQHGFSEGR
ncbi:MAG TPA: hypothetical protein PLZ79_06810, partial [Burkholderiales bacterium]|nr:hypothetical protein [Burkholderiales bacterium]